MNEKAHEQKKRVFSMSQRSTLDWQFLIPLCHIGEANSIILYGILWNCMLSNSMWHYMLSSSIYETTCYEVLYETTCYEVLYETVCYHYQIQYETMCYQVLYDCMSSLSKSTWDCMLSCPT